MTLDRFLIREFGWYAGNLAWLKGRTIVLGPAGSHAYGTSLPSSDLDLKGVCVAPKAYHLGFVDSFEQAEAKNEVDAVVYEIRKYFKLAADANPNILELLFLPEDAYYLVHPTWEHVLEHRDLFLSRKAQHTFSGYAVAQLRRIKTHRRWLLDPPKEPPTRGKYGLPEGRPTVGKETMGVINARIKKLEDVLGGAGLTKDQVETKEAGLIRGAMEELELTSDLFEVIRAERAYAAACQEWQQYQTWKAERNATRAELEARHGYDTKHGMHLVRLMRMGHEILSGQGVMVRRPDAEELLAIRGGAWPYELLEAYAASMDAAMKLAATGSPLPHSPDRKALDKVLVEIVEDWL